jgi:nucleoside-diphosphate-sugar epimerase
LKALVTGGGGFLGGAVVRALLARGDQVRSLARGDYPALRDLGVETQRGDLAIAGVAEAAVEGCDIVFHVAAKPGVWGPYTDYYQANVEATRNVIAACKSAGVRRLVYTSSPSVVFDGTDLEGIDETHPYPESYIAHYPATKAEAERLVIAANNSELSTVSLRPHLIWGPGDNHLVPRLIARQRSGALRRIGPGKLIDTVYIDNAASAHLLAADRLKPGAACAGKTYFISNDEPRPLWDFVDQILVAAGESKVVGSVSPAVAYVAGAILEGLWGMLGIKSEPRMTRFLAKELSTAHWFDISAAKRDLGYHPQVSIDQGLARLQAALTPTDKKSAA